MIDKQLLESSQEIPLTDEDRQRIEKMLRKQTKGFSRLKSAIAQRVDELAGDSIKGGQGSGNFGHSGRPGIIGGSDGSGQNEFEKIHTSHTQGDTKSQFYHNGEWDKRRVKKVHEPALRSYTEGVTKAPDGKPVLYMTGGGYGSGKSGLLDKFPEAVGFPPSGQSARVDPDATKGFIPEYQKMTSDQDLDPGAATHVHEESSEIAKRGVKESLGAGYHVTYDTSGDSNTEKLEHKIESYRAAGATQVIGNYAFPGSIEEGQRRADYRAEHSEGLRRYVDPALLAANHAEVSRTWMALAERGAYDKLGLWSTAGPLGTPPTLIASAEKGKIHVVDAAMFDKFKKIGGR